MRVIKFRGKTFNGKWVFGDLVQLQHGCFIHWNDRGMRISDEVDVNTVGQFTGLHDKNGVEIYEGDKVNVISSNMAGNPIYKDNMTVTEITDFGLMYTLNHANELEVIGNIHESEDK